MQNMCLCFESLLLQLAAAARELPPPSSCRGDHNQYGHEQLAGRKTLADFGEREG